jgi:hypothetical protein
MWAGRGNLQASPTWGDTWIPPPKSRFSRPLTPGTELDACCWEQQVRAPPEALQTSPLGPPVPELRATSVGTAMVKATRERIVTSLNCILITGVLKFECVESKINCIIKRLSGFLVESVAGWRF